MFPANSNPGPPRTLKELSKAYESWLLPTTHSEIYPDFFFFLLAAQAATKIRAYLLSLISPIRMSLATNIHVIQTSLLINKYLPLYRFLQRRAQPAAEEIRDVYIRCAKLYYETGMRRYTRSLGYLRVTVPLLHRFGRSLERFSD